MIWVFLAAPVSVDTALDTDLMDTGAPDVPNPVRV